jgi:hypothetical protein
MLAPRRLGAGGVGGEIMPTLELGEHLSVFHLDRWPSNVAIAWVLTRNRKFVEAACALGRGPYAIETEVEEQRRRGRPVMLFPSIQAAHRAIKSEFGSSADYPSAEVLAKFPSISESVGGDSVWRGLIPRDRRGHRIPLAHALWWIASRFGTKLFALDNRIKWKAAWKRLQAQILSDRVSLIAEEPPPARPIPHQAFGAVPISCPCGASSSYGLRFYYPYRDTYINLSLETVSGDQYFEQDSKEAKLFRLMVQSQQLLRAFEQTFSRSNRSNEGAVDQFVADYIDTELKANRRPTVGGCENAWAANHQGYRNEVRVAYRHEAKRRHIAVKRGPDRPPPIGKRMGSSRTGEPPPSRWRGAWCADCERAL